MTTPAEPTWYVTDPSTGATMRVEADAKSAARWVAWSQVVRPDAGRRAERTPLRQPRSDRHPGDLRMTLPRPRPPDRFGHADAWMSPPAPSNVVDVDAWAERERYHWAARLFIEGDSRRCERINVGAEIIEACAKRHAAVRAALQIRTDGPGPGPCAICLNPEQRQLLRAALVALSTR